MEGDSLYPMRHPQYEQGSSNPMEQLGQPQSFVGQQLQSPDRSTPFAGPSSSSPNFVPAVGQMTHAPSSHFISSGSFDFGGRLNEGLGELDTAGLLPNLGSQPLEMTEMELESTPESEPFASPREYGGYSGAATHGPAGPAGNLAHSPIQPVLVCCSQSMPSKLQVVFLALSVSHVYSTHC